MKPSSPSKKSLEKLQEYEGQVKRILSSSLILNPINVDVSNVSCWYYMRKKLKAKKHNAIILKQNTNTNLHEGFIYDLKRREEDLEIVPKKVLIGSGEDRFNVFKQCEIAVRERDKQRVILEETNLDQRKYLVLNSHIRLTVVSEAFYRVKPMERIRMVYQELLNIAGINVQQTTMNPKDFYHCSPNRLKGISTFGKNVCNLPIFRFIDNSQTEMSTIFLITALTPSQWKPNDYRPPISERLGETHLGAAVLQTNPVAKPKQQKDRVKKLTTPVENKDPYHQSSLIPPPSSASNADPANPVSAGGSTVAGKIKDPTVIADSLGLDATISGVKYKKLGGIYGHFFNDLSADVKEMVMMKYQTNRELIRDESRLPPPSNKNQEDGGNNEDTFKPITNANRFKTKTQIMKDGLADKGTKNMNEMREEVLISNRRIELAAIRIQRIRRCNLYIRMVKFYWKSQYAAITIQRCIRGRFGRRYFKIYSRLKPIAAVKIQRYYRAIISQRIIDHWQYLVYRMTRRILPKIKLFIKNCYQSWINRRMISAIKIQNCIRRYLSRTIFYKRLGKTFFLQNYFEKNIILIQKIMRSYLGRKQFQIYLHDYLIRAIDTPAAIRLQRIFRGRLAKKYLIFLKYERKCLLLLQKVIKRFVHRKWEKELRYQKLLKKSAIMIQRRYRGYYDRKLYKLKYFFFFYTMIYIPMTIKLQSYIRRFNAAVRVSLMKKRYRAAKRIQNAYHNYKLYLKQKELRRQFYEAYRNARVVVIQKYCRRYLCRKKYLRWIVVQRGREIHAAKIIFRAWKTFQLNLKYNILIEDFRIHEEEKLLLKYVSLKKGIVEDNKEIQYDINLTEKTKERLKKRIVELDSFLVQAAFRCTKIKNEMKILTMEDFEKGWAEALGQEYETIAHQELMAREELRLYRHRLYLAEEELFALYLEYEENELEIDQLDQLMIGAMEKSRLRQILYAERKANLNTFKAIYREKVHWKVTSNRTKKVFNNRQRNKEIIEQSKTGRPTDYFTTITYEKRQRRRDYEQLMQEMQFANEARERDSKSKPKTYEEYAIPFQRAYDKVIHNSLGTLRAATLDERAKRIRDQFRANIAEKKKAQKGQFYSLKEDFPGKA